MVEEKTLKHLYASVQAFSEMRSQKILTPEQETEQREKEMKERGLKVSEEK